MSKYSINATVQANGFKDATGVSYPTKTYVDNLGNSLTGQIKWEEGTGEHSVQTKSTGCDARGDYSIAEGNGTLAESDYSHAEGWVSRTIIDDTDLESHGHASHAEGSHTIAKGTASHAEGNTTESMGAYSHSEGSGTISGGRSSHAEGDGTIAENVAEHAEGSYNKSHSTANGDDGDTLHSIGIGTSMTDRKNAFEVLQNGDAYLLGVGGYEGRDLEGAKTIAETISSKQDKLVFADEDEFPYDQYNAAVTKDYLEDRITIRCLTKVVPFGTTGDFLYGVNNTGTTPKFPQYPLSANTINDSVVKRTNKGKIKAKDPEADDDVVTLHYFDAILSTMATKTYVDNSVAGVVKTVTLTQAEFDALTEYADNTNYQII